MEVFDAVYLVCGVDSKRNAVQALAAHDATEAPGVVRLAGRPKDAVEDRLRAHATFLQGILKQHGKRST